MLIVGIMMLAQAHYIFEGARGTMIQEDIRSSEKYPFHAQQCCIILGEGIY